MKHILMLVIALSACTPEQTRDQVYNEVTPEPTISLINEAKQKEEKAEAIKLSKIESKIHNNPELNWINIGISTGKFSESIRGKVYKTWDECEAGSFSEDNTCVPINALPESYWKVQP